MESLESSRVRPRQARYQAALRPDTMHVDDSTVLFGFPLSDLQSDCARTVQISLAFEALCTIVRGPNH
jgi:hypothetical protein